MRDKRTNKAVNELYESMLKWWQKNRSKPGVAGFLKAHEQSLYDAVCTFGEIEKSFKD